MEDYSIEWILSMPESYRYQMLDRMKMDCNYHLGNGQLYGTHLWAGNEKDQIEYMKRIWNSLPEKPEWLSLSQIEDFERKMCTVEISGFVGEYRFLSNFYPCHISFYNLQFTSVEAAFQAAKCQDVNQREKFCGLSAAEAKRFGRTVALRSDWDQSNVKIMNSLLVRKFHENPELRERLIATGVAPLMESNTWHDDFWGNCTCNRCKCIEGSNILGRILMDIRMSYTAICGPGDTEFYTKMKLAEDE